MQSEPERVRDRQSDRRAAAAAGHHRGGRSCIPLSALSSPLASSRALAGRNCAPHTDYRRRSPQRFKIAALLDSPHAQLACATRADAEASSCHVNSAHSTGGERKAESTTAAAAADELECRATADRCCCDSQSSVECTARLSEAAERERIASGCRNQVSAPSSSSRESSRDARCADRTFPRNFQRCVRGCSQQDRHSSTASAARQCRCRDSCAGGERKWCRTGRCGVRSSGQRMRVQQRAAFGCVQ